MSSLILTAYHDLRDDGRGHHAAVRELARRLSVDHDTAGRIVKRAAQDETRFANTIPKENQP